MIVEGLVWVKLDYACYGLVIHDGRVAMAPPIARWMIGRTEAEAAAWLRRKGATWKVLSAP